MIGQFIVYQRVVKNCNMSKKKEQNWMQYGVRIFFNTAAHPIEYAKVLIQVSHLRLRLDLIAGLIKKTGKKYCSTFVKKKCALQSQISFGNYKILTLLRVTRFGKVRYLLMIVNWFRSVGFCNQSKLLTTCLYFSFVQRMI